MFRTYLILGMCLLCGIQNAAAIDTSLNTKLKEEQSTVVLMKHTDVLSFAKEEIKQGQLENARKILLAKPFDNKELEIERLYLLAQIATLEGKTDEAIDIYYFILNYEPNIANIRFRLSNLLLKRQDWYRADYHFRLALANKNTPLAVQKYIKESLQYIRQNKNWNFWFNFGIAPDNNVNNTTSGEQCVMTMFGLMCNTLDDKEKDVGLTASLGGYYEYKLSDNWRIKNEAMAYTARYNDKKYDDVYLYNAIGLRYVYDRGDVFFGPTFSRRYLGRKAYNYTTGFKVDTNYDITEQLSANLELSYTPTKYDDYGEVLDGSVNAIRTRLFYALNNSKYLLFKAGYEYENTKDKVYANYRNNYALGFGSELFYGFHLYLEPSIQYINYKGTRWTVKDYSFKQIKERDIITKYSISLSNRNLSLWDFVPTLTYSYIDKSSNIWQREYQKSMIELSIQKRF